MWLDAVSAALLVDAATGTVFTSSVEYTAINLQKKHAHCDSCREGGQDELHVGVHRQFHFDTDTEFIYYGYSTGTYCTGTLRVFGLGFCLEDWVFRS